jgi:uncharacterized membrane protein YdfJ with MMPL/SSD domain
VVAVSMIASLTVLPAVMSRLGDGVDRGRLPGLRRVKARMARLGLWSRVVDRVMARPLLWGGVTTALLVALTIPAFSMQTGTPDTDTLPHKYATIRGLTPDRSAPTPHRHTRTRAKGCVA